MSSTPPHHNNNNNNNNKNKKKIVNDTKATTAKTTPTPYSTSRSIRTSTSSLLTILVLATSILLYFYSPLLEDFTIRKLSQRMADREKQAEHVKLNCPHFLVVRSNRVITDSKSGVHPATIFIKNGKIDRIASNDEHEKYALLPPQHVHDDKSEINRAFEMNCRWFIDAGDAIVMPGMVDTHVHMNEPGRTHWEGFEAVTKGAAAGGVTTVIDMPLNSLPPTTNVSNLQQKVAASEGKRYVDVGFLGGVIPGNEQDLLPLWKAGVLGFKSFMIHSGVDEFPAVSEHDMQVALETLQGTNAVYMLHAEVSIPEVEENNKMIFETADGRKYINFLKTRPPEMETEAVQSVLNVCKKEYGVRCHIVHVAASEVIPILREAQKKSDHITAETCTHYLYFHSEQVPDGATEYKCCPPIRNATNQELLWEAMREGVLSMVTSDHSPSPTDMKNGDFLRSWGGISSLEVSLSAMVNPAIIRGFKFNDLVKWKCEEPAKLVGLDKVKGRIAPGMDGDLVIWSSSESFVLDVHQESMFKHKHKSSPFHNRVLQGKVQMSILRGNIIYDVKRNGLQGAPKGALLLASQHQ